MRAEVVSCPLLEVVWEIVRGGMSAVVFMEVDGSVRSCGCRSVSWCSSGSVRVGNVSGNVSGSCDRSVGHVGEVSLNGLRKNLSVLIFPPHVQITTTN